MHPKISPTAHYCLSYDRYCEPCAVFCRKYRQFNNRMKEKSDIFLSKIKFGDFIAYYAIFIFCGYGKIAYRTRCFTMCENPRPPRAM